MSYVVFALKWRPKNFDEIIGQDHIVSTLKSAIEKGRLAHAYLFAGPRGVGKTSAARILAKALNCKESKGFDPCGKCSSCLEISQGRSMDVIEIDGASNRGIDEIRALRENVKFSPVSGKYKIYIIDEVHQITPDGFNALLKTLEEPPEFVKFIFATTHPHKVIPTILSRCQRLDFRRIPLLEIISQLERIVKAEKISVDKEVLLAIAKSSDGSLRDAESVLDQMVSFSKNKISLNDVISVLGLVEQEVLFELTDKIIKKDAKAALGLFNRLIDEGKDISSFIGNLIEHFRNLMVAKVANADSKLIDLPQDICDRLLVQAREFSLEEIFIAFNILVNTQEMSKRLESMRIPLEISLVKLANDKKGLAQSESAQPLLKDKPAEHVYEKPAKFEERKAFEHPEPVKKVLPNDHLKDSFSEGKTITFEKISSSWQEIIEALSKITMSLSTYLNEGTLVGMEGNALTVAFPKNCSLHKESLEDRENKAVIEKVVAGFCGGTVRFNFILSEQIKDKADDPVLRTALKTFNGRVVKEE